jgi:hypothetical protein
MSLYDEDATLKNKKMSKLFETTRKAFSKKMKTQKTLRDIKKKRDKKLAEMQLLAKRERYEIWNQNDMAKLFLLEIIKLGERCDKRTKQLSEKKLKI